MTEKTWEQLAEGDCICIDETGKQYKGGVDYVDGIGKVVFVCYPSNHEIVKYLQ